MMTLTNKELYDSLSEDLKADIHSVIHDRAKLVEVAKKHNLTYRQKRREYAKSSFLNMIKVVEEFEV